MLRYGSKYQFGLLFGLDKFVLRDVAEVVHRCLRVVVVRGLCKDMEHWERQGLQPKSIADGELLASAQCIVLDPLLVTRRNLRPL